MTTSTSAETAGATAGSTDRDWIGPIGDRTSEAGQIANNSC